jgi:hypothetical protein
VMVPSNPPVRNVSAARTAASDPPTMTIDSMGTGYELFVDCNLFEKTDSF